MYKITLMNSKTKVFSLIIGILLILPILFSQQRSTGNVLGVNESSTNTNSSIGSFLGSISQRSPQTQEDITPKESQIIKSVGSGVRIKSDTIKETTTPYFGKAILNSNSTVQAASDKFPIGTTIKVTANSQSIDVVIQDKAILTADTLLVLNKDTFKKLGGNEETRSIEIVVYET